MRRDDQHAELDRLGVDAGIARRRLAAAGRQHPAAEAGAAQHDMADRRRGPPSRAAGRGSARGCRRRTARNSPGDRIGTAAVSEIHIATPLAMPIIASVVRNDGMPTRVVSQPLNMPTARPVARPASDPGEGPGDGDRHGDRDGGKPRDGADRQVDLARREHEGHGDRHHRDHRRLADDVEQVVGVEEPLVARASAAKTTKMTTKPI